MLLKPFDYGVMTAAFGAVIASFLVVYGETEGRGVIHIQGESGEWIFPTDAVETMAVSGPLGNTVIAIQDGGVCIVSSPCRNQTCVAAGIVRSPGQWTACLPNCVMVYVNEGESRGDIDAEAW